MTEQFTCEVKDKRLFHTLDGLRGVAALAVVLFHLGAYVSPISIGSAYLAVDMFFALSGFVLMLAYSRRLERELTVGKFVVLRIVRLYPLYFLGFAVALVPLLAALLLGDARTWTWTKLGTASIASILFVPAPPINGLPAMLFPLNPPAWSLFFELVVNLLFALLLRLHLRRVIPVLVIGSAAALLIAAATNGSLDGGWIWSNLWIGLVRVLFSFFLGVMAFDAHDRGWMMRIACPSWLILALTMSVLWLQPPTQWRPAYDVVCVLAILPTLLWLGIGNEPRHGSSIFAALGIISYPIYAIHVPVITLILGTADRMLHGSASTSAPFTGLALIVLLLVACRVLASTYDVVARRLLAKLVGLEAPRVA